MMETWRGLPKTPQHPAQSGKVPLEMPSLVPLERLPRGFGEQGTHAESDVTVTPGAEHVAPDYRGKNVGRPDATATKRSGDISVSGGPNDGQPKRTSRPRPLTPNTPLSSRGSTPDARTYGEQAAQLHVGGSVGARVCMCVYVGVICVSNMCNMCGHIRVVLVVVVVVVVVLV